jgi:hypothetical protein
MRRHLRWFVALLVGVTVSVMAGMPAAHAAPPRRLDIATVPVVPGFPVVLDGRTRITDRNGVARFQHNNRPFNTGRVTLTAAEVMLDGRPVKAVASRVFGGGRPRVTMDISWRMSFDFVDVNGEPVDVARIEKIRVKSSIGEIREIKPGETPWMQGSRVVTLSGGLENKKIYWTVQEVDYAGTNVVNASQQRFQPADTQSVKLTLLFYRTSIGVRDAFFGFGTGSAVRLTYPDSTVALFPLSDAHDVALPSLPRGSYLIEVAGPGPRMSRPVAVSRDQSLDLKFYSWLDIGLVVGFGLAFAGGTLWIGWRRRVAHHLATQGPLTQPVRAAGPVPLVAWFRATISRRSQNCVKPAPPPAAPVLPRLEEDAS